MEHVFLLLVYLNNEIVSRDMYFYDLNDCVWYAQKLHKQGQQITAYCLPKYIVVSRERVY